MNKTIKNILKGILFVVIAIVVIFLCIRTYYKFFNSNDADLTTEETDILLLSQTYPTTFYFIGDTIPLDKSILKPISPATKASKYILSLFILFTTPASFVEYSLILAI